MLRRQVRGGPAAANERLFPVVGVGASAGGLEAFTQLLRHVPPDTGMAFVLVQHLDPTHTSLLGEVISRATEMPVAEAADGVRVEPDHVYVIPPNADLGMADGRLTVASGAAGARPHLPIDAFFRDLARERGPRAIGVVLSGTASDGTEGLRAIQAENGVTIAQEPASAKFPGMPESAIAAGVVDQALPIVGIAEALTRLAKHPYVAAGKPEGARDDDAIAAICGVVRRATGVDFTAYKASTFDRRLARRMALRQTATHPEYLALLERDAEEPIALYEDALIHVTSFFRDPEVFDALKRDVFPAILAHKTERAPVRVWVAGCSTGEEVYSLAIALLEYLSDGAGDGSHAVQLFGTDASERAIERARRGVYAEGALRDIGEERRRKYFTKVDGAFVIRKSVRDLCVFVHHDLATDPPFSKLDLVSCRNVLIYFGPDLQRRIVAMLHYCLVQPGFLLLGASESIGGFPDLFSVVDKDHKIFARTAAASALTFTSRTESRPLPRAAQRWRTSRRRAPPTPRGRSTGCSSRATRRPACSWTRR